MVPEGNFGGDNIFGEKNLANLSTSLSKRFYHESLIRYQ